MTYQPKPCTACGGNRGRTETTVGPDGVTRQVWRTCPGCGGQGVR